VYIERCLCNDIMKKIVLIMAVSLLVAATTARAQGTGDYEYNREFIWGVTKATNSGLIGGLVLKYGSSLGERKYQTFGLEMVNIKHPQEQRQFTTTGTYIWGKTNYLYSVRLQYGREWIVFKKAPQQGVQISGILSAGPSMGLEAPYYLNYGPHNDVQRVLFNPSLSYENIRGTGNIFYSIGKAKLVPGFNAKSSLSFEFGTFRSNVMGLETGFMFEGFSREINILSNQNNQQFFPNAFVTLYYGSRR
jgi:hypothetical protein